MKTTLMNIIIFIIFYANLYGQKSNWMVYNTDNSPIPSNSIRKITIDKSGNIWLAIYQNLTFFDGINWINYKTPQEQDRINELKVDSSYNVWCALEAWHPGEGGKLWQFDTLNKNWTNFNELPGNLVSTIEIDKHGAIWYGNYSYFDLAGKFSYFGLTKFDGIDYITYDTSNTGLASNSIRDILFDDFDNIWIASGDNGSDWPPSTKNIYGGVTKFDGYEWTVFDTTNSPLPNNYVTTLAFDKDGILWIGTRNGLASYGSSDWSIYTSENSPLPNNSIIDIEIGTDNSKWIVTISGVAKYNLEGWEIFTDLNSRLPARYIKDLAIDSKNNKFFATQDSGLVIYKESIYEIGHEKKSLNTGTFSLSQNYPNPFNLSTNIKFEVNKPEFITLKIFDITGREKITLIENYFPPGSYIFKWDAKNCPSGIYICQLNSKIRTEFNKLVLLK